MKMKELKEYLNIRYKEINTIMDKAKYKANKNIWAERLKEIEYILWVIDNL